MQRRCWLALPLSLAFSAAWARPDGNAVLVDVWKSPTCGCCKDWLTHLIAKDGSTATYQRY